MLDVFADANPYFLAVFALGLAGSPFVLKVSLDIVEETGLAQVAPSIVGYLAATLLALSLAITGGGGESGSVLPHLLLLATAGFYAALLVASLKMNSEDTTVSAVVEERM